jgi:hypothetical protein
MRYARGAMRGGDFSLSFGAANGATKKERGGLGLRLGLRWPPSAQKCNNQQIVGISGGGWIKEEIWPRRNVGVGGLSVVLDNDSNDKK